MKKTDWLLAARKFNQKKEVQMFGRSCVPGTSIAMENTAV